MNIAQFVVLLVAGLVISVIYVILVQALVSFLS
jgi:hypothetical protein